MNLSKKEYQELAEALKIKLTPYIPHVPHETQHAFLWLSCLEALYGGASGGGKALGLDTPVLTPSGWSTMGDLKPGDFVFGDNGQPTRVLACSEVMVGRPCFRLTFDDGTSVVCDARHRWKTMTIDERLAARRRSQSFRARRRASRASRVAGNRTPTQSAAIRKTNRARGVAQRGQLLKIPYGEIRETYELASSVKIGGATNHSIQVCQPLDFPVAVLPVDPYLLGAWLGDGSTGSGQIGLYEQAMIDQLVAVGASLTLREEFGQFTVHGLGRQLKELRVLGNKRIPGRYLRASYSQRVSLLQGLMDTDGSCDARGQCSFTTVLPGLARDFLHLLRGLGIKATVSKNLSYLYGVRKRDRYRFKFTTTITAFRLERKISRQQSRTDWRGTQDKRYLISCEPVESVPVRCIQVEAENGMFLIGEGLISTHNSDALLMAALQYVDIPGYNAILFRKTYADLNLPGSLIPRSREWLTGTDAKWNENDSRWTFPSGATVSFGYMRNNDDRFRYQSAQFLFCVARDTGILMADGSLRPIQEIRVGDQVQTFIGPKDVLAVHRVGARNRALIETPAGRALVSVGHPLLTPYGWVSPYEMLPTVFGESCKRLSSSGLKFQAPLQHTLHPLEDLWRTSVLTGLVRGDNPHQAFFSKVVAALENYDRGSAELSPVFGTPPWGFVPLRLYEPLLRKIDSELHSWNYDRPRVSHELLQPDSYGDYPAYASCGELRNSLVESSPSGTLPPIDAVAPSHAYQHVDASGNAHGHTLRALSSLYHPYTKEKFDVYSGWADRWSKLTPAGVGECWDLTVSEASHYIIANCVSSAQCGFDELTHFTKLQYTYMFSRLRKPEATSRKNPLAEVPLRMRAATNPGGRGHLWVRNRFVKPMGQRDDEPEEPTQRIFIPAKLTDNPSVDAKSYLAALSQVDEATQQQLIHGDWDAREIGPWVIPDPTWIEAAAALGLELWESGNIPVDNSKMKAFGIDWGEFTQAYIIWPMPDGGVYVPPSEVVGEHEDPAHVGLRMLATAERMGLLGKIDVARYDAAGIQSMRTFASTARARPGWERLRTQKIPFNKYKRESINYLKLLFRNAAAGRKTRYIAIHPENSRLLQQLRMWSRKDDESEDVDKHDDHGPDAIIAGIAPIAAAHRRYIEHMIAKAKEKRGTV